MKLTWENRSTPGKTCSSATLSTTNPGLRGGRPATNRLSHDTVILVVQYTYKNLFIKTPIKQVVTLVSNIQEMLISNLARDTDYPD
jgi:hypothetical protein